MKLTEYVESLDLEIKVTFGANRAGPWIANICKRNGFSVDYKDSRDDCMLRSATGWGKTPDEALLDLCKNIKSHKFIVFGQSNDERNILPLPNLEYL